MIVVANQKINIGKYTALTVLANHGIKVILNGNYAIKHNKLMVFQCKQDQGQ